MKNFLLAASFFLLAHAAVDAASPPPEETEYLRMKESGNYEEAIELLKKWTLSTGDAGLAETNSFRIWELMIHPELYPRGMGALDEIQKSRGKANPFLSDRIDLFRLQLLIRTGNPAEAKSILDSFGYMSFDIIGPFKNNSAADFNAALDPERDMNLSKYYAGKTHRVSWFRCRPDLTGMIDVDDLSPETRNSLFYLHGEINAGKSGEYFIIMGKTGYADLWLDGERIFKSRVQHGFLHDQYFIKVFLEKGAHHVLLKAGDSRSGIKISMRIAESGGKRIIPAPAGPERRDASGSRLIETGPFPALKEMAGMTGPEEFETFRNAYLIMMSGMDGDDDSRAEKLFSKIGPASALYSSSCCYSGRIERPVEKKDLMFRRSLEGNPGNIESLERLAALKTEGGFHLEAYPLIRRISEKNRKAPEYHFSLLRLYGSKGWDYDADRVLSEMKKSAYRSAYLSAESSVLMNRKEYLRASESLGLYCGMDRHNRDALSNLAECLEKAGKTTEAVSGLNGAIALFPNAIDFKLRLARIMELKYGPEKAVPVLAAALAQSPYNREVLSQLGLAYHKSGKKRLSLYYLRSSLQCDPNNFALKRYIDIIEGNKNELDSHLYAGSTGRLAEKASRYSDEQAVVLLNETAIKVNIDGSSEKHVRKVVKINDNAAVKDFKSQVVVFDPENESIENLRCVLVNGGSRINISERYTRSLSDPESRLYYNLKAEIVPVNSIMKGSVLDFSYRIKNRGGRDYRNYFGERIQVGGKYRTMATRIILLHPSGKKVYCHARGLLKKTVRTERGSSWTATRVDAGDTPPYKKEEAMPHYSRVLPAVYFTSMKSWDELCAWYRAFLKDKIRVSGEMKAALKKILPPGAGPEEKAARIYTHVTETVRYVGFEFGSGSISPRSSDMTYMSRMGDCKDTALVLAALLREAGLDSRIALVRTRDRGAADLSVPFMGEFNHAICYVAPAVPGGRAFFIDGTSRQSGIRELPQDDRNITALVIDEIERPGKARGYFFMNTDTGFYHEDMVKVDDSVSLDGEGNAAVTRTLLKKGAIAPSMRSDLSSPERRTRSIIEYWNQSYPGSSVDGFQVLGSDVDKPVSYRYGIRIPSFAQKSGGDIVFHSFINRSNFFQNYAVTVRREHDIEMGPPSVTEASVKYAIPEGYLVRGLPKNERYDGKNYLASFIYEAGDGIVSVKSKISVNCYRIDRRDYEDFRVFARFIDRKEQERIVLEKKK